MKLNSLILLFVLALTAGCRDNSGQVSSDSLNSFAIEWSTLKFQTDYASQIFRQSECEPSLVSAEGDAIGTIFMVHGFTACNQQFYDWADRLKERGYNVVLPTMPGHGVGFTNGSITYESMFLPSQKEAYENFAKSIVTLAKNSETPNNNIIVGISVGGAVAARAAIEELGVFRKVLLLSPFLAIPNTYSQSADDNLLPLNVEEEASIIAEVASISPDAQLNTIAEIWAFVEDTISDFRVGTSESIIALLRETEVISKLDIGWGESCEFERATGRAGICTFKAGNLLAVDAFGRDVIDAYSNAQTLPSLYQIVGVENDDGADSNAINDLYTFIANVKPEDQHSICLYPQGQVPHSFISKYDNINLANENAPDVHASALENMLDMWLSVFLEEAQLFFDATDFRSFSNNNGMCVQ